MKQSYYDDIKYRELKKMVDKCKLKLVKDSKNKDCADDGESMMIESMYERSSLAGFTDYKDHRSDSLPQLKKMVYQDIEDRLLQRGNYYSIDDKPMNKILLKGYLGGWTATIAFPNNSKNAFGR